MKKATEFASSDLSYHLILASPKKRQGGFSAIIDRIGAKVKKKTIIIVTGMILVICEYAFRSVDQGEQVLDFPNGFCTNALFMMYNRY